MKTYENGMQTRKLILETSRKLFLDKGFWETSYDDICSALYLNRSTVRYHFGSREKLRYEVLWNMFYAYRDLAAGYLDVPKAQMLAALYLQWCHVTSDFRVRRFHLQYCKDFPAYVPGKSLPLFYDTLYRYIFADNWAIGNIPALRFSSVYGHLMAQMQLIGERPEDFDGKELFLHGMEVCLHCWNMPPKQPDTIQQLTSQFGDPLPQEVPDSLHF